MSGLRRFNVLGSCYMSVLFNPVFAFVDLPSEKLWLGLNHSCNCNIGSTKGLFIRYDACFNCRCPPKKDVNLRNRTAE